ncbi:uncharacterized protein LOC132031975 [Lycium ferocissimum]|uniref:uncharacterized protein LOC132031975 n=1 Tax=Lycium ferocissimum TaxID=112874 RepID=UPI0028156490|nr:uncharacterized protein LOC132031975 [Lycium ferocissimum]
MEDGGRVFSNDENARRPHRALVFDKEGDLEAGFRNNDPSIRISQSLGGASKGQSDRGPKAKATKIVSYSLQLGLQNNFFNCNNKIWLFWSSELNLQVLDNTEQQVTCKIIVPRQQDPLFISVKSGERPYRISKSIDFLNCLEDCGLVDAGYFGTKYTWCNDRGFPKTIWKRLDRVLINTEWANELRETTVQHLARVSLDHAPLFITLSKPKISGPRYFKFLEFWVEHQDFKTIVAETCWSRQAFGDIYEEPKRLEKQIEDIEIQLIADNNPAKRSELNLLKAKYHQFLKLQDSILKQKAKAKWLEKGDRNTAFFHSVIKGRRKRLNLQRIQDNDEVWREGSQDIANTAIHHFHKIFNHSDAVEDLSLLNCLQPRVTQEENDMLTTLPTMEEVKASIFSINPDSSLGPEGLDSTSYL